MHSQDELRRLVEASLDRIDLDPDLGALEEAVRYALVGGKRIRAVLCLATAEAAGARAEDAVRAAEALELVQAFSLVHDDLPALDDDAERRGRPSVWARFGEATAVLAGDALLAEAFRRAAAYDSTEIAGELATATLGMIGGQHLDLRPEAAPERVNPLKTGRLFVASVASGLWVARVPPGQQAPWRAFADELGPLFQLVDDLLDGDGSVLVAGRTRARELAEEAAERARQRLAYVPADTHVLADVVSALAMRTA